jgi:hypothetical protein
LLISANENLPFAAETLPQTTDRLTRRPQIQGALPMPLLKPPFPASNGPEIKTHAQYLTRPRYSAGKAQPERSKMSNCQANNCLI